MKKFKKRNIGNAIFVLPSLLTTGNLFCGFYSIIASLQGQFDKAAWVFVLAGLFDVLDGRVARLTRSATEFGTQYDSLCDLISFGLAPSILAFQIGFNQFGRVGWLVCFVYVACGALRLARFNVQSATDKTNGDFTGLPIPMAAGIMLSWVVVGLFFKNEINLDEYPAFSSIVLFFEHQSWSLIVLAAAMFLSALMMVSNFQFRSHKTLISSKEKPFRLLVIFVLLGAIAMLNPEIAALIIFWGYVVWAFLDYILGLKKLAKEEEIFEAHDDGQSVMEP